MVHLAAQAWASEGHCVHAGQAGGRRAAAWNAITGLAVWHPGRRLADLPLSDLEYGFGHETQEDGGMGLVAELAGLVQSPARGELDAALLALSAPCPVHLCLDNRALLSPCSD